MPMIITSECENCINGSVNDSDKAKVMVFCSAKDKTYYYGQCVLCNDKKRRGNEINGNDTER